jgi:kynurenine formamidase
MSKRGEGDIKSETSDLVYEPLFERDGAIVSKSPWGPDDKIGRLNWITPESRKSILNRLNGDKVLDLSVDYFIGMPSWAAAGDPKFDIWMTHTPQGSVVDDLSGAGRKAHERNSYCGDSVAFYTHCGTHIDTLNHMGYFGCFWNGWTPEQHLGSRHWIVGGPEKHPVIIARGVLLDIAGLHSVDCLPEGYGITPEDLRGAGRKQGVELRKGDVVLLRTGRMTRWPDPDAYLQNSPGLTVPGARYLCEEAGAMVVGTDAIGLDCYPAKEPDTYLPVHSYMFATAGALIVEVVWMEQLAADKVYEFAFIGGGLKLTGATGAPMRPIAVLLRE